MLVVLQFPLIIKQILYLSIGNIDPKVYFKENICKWCVVHVYVYLFEASPFSDTDIFPCLPPNGKVKYLRV